MKKTALAFLILFAFALLPVFSHAVASQGKMQIFAVTSEGTGLSADLVLRISQGNGKIWSSVEPLVGTTTQSAERTSIEVAKAYYPKAADYDYKFEIDSNASLVDGPSAGSAMALLAITMLRDKKIPPYVGLTGTISKDGFIGPVGGVFEKAKYASQWGIRLFLIPMGESKQVAKVDGNTLKSVNLREYALQNWGMKVIEVKNIDEALTYAFLDFNSVDVNISTQESLPDFAPKGSALPEQLRPMRELNGKYIEKAKQEISDAKSALSTTLLEDTDLVNLLLESLNESEKTVKQAELLYDQNYLYSSANYVFLARVNAQLVRDVAENPSIVSANSTIFEKNVSELGKEAQGTKQSLSEYIPLDYLEWHVAAQQRLAWAEINIEKLQGTETIVVGSTQSDAYYNAIFSRIKDYEFAKNWLEVAKDLEEISVSSKNRVVPDGQFKNFNDKAIKEASGVLDSLTSSDLEDAARRLNASKLERDYEWYLASAMDSSSAIALLNANYDSKALSLAELQSALSRKIISAESGIRASNRKFVWAELYLAHAKYFLESSKFYEEHGSGAQAASSAANGLSLVMLAQGLYETTGRIYSYYDSAKKTDYVSASSAGAGAQAGIPAGGANTLLLIGAIIVMIAALIVLALAVLRLGFAKKVLSEGTELQKVRRLQLESDKQFLEGNISEEKHSALSKKYSMESERLESEKKSRSREIIELDLFRAELLAFEKALRELKGHYKSGFITSQDYSENLKRYQLKIGALKESVERERLALKDESKKLFDSVSRAAGANQAVYKKGGPPISSRRQKPRKAGRALASIAGNLSGQKRLPKQKRK